MEYKNLYGYFSQKTKGAYVIQDTQKTINAEYIYQNRDILLKVDKYGLAYSQYLPPKDIVLFKRNDSDKFSKWQVWIECKQDNMLVSNFSFPRKIEPIKGHIEFSPEKAKYVYQYKNFSVITTVSVPFKGSSIIVNVTVENNSDKALDFKITPTLYPYFNTAQIALWDKGEWYLETSAGKRNGITEFVTRLNNPAGIKENRRLATFQVSGNPSIDISMERFCGNGSFDCPDSLKLSELPILNNTLKEDVFSKTDIMQCYPPVYANMYNVTLSSKEQKTFTQVLSIQDKNNCGEYSESEAKENANYIIEENVMSEQNKISNFFELFCSNIYVKTEDKDFDNYVNSFLPLQMYWVASLDRGWPTGMRGVRDASNDFMGMLYYDLEWSKETLLYLFSCQREDGWMPRQVSDESRHGKHDLRPYVDGGAFLLEFLYNFIAFTGDFEILKKEINWLSGENKDTLYVHAIRAIEYYISKENLGEHGLCKIYGGDWLDAVNQAGLEGRGESVMVSAQTVINLSYMAEITLKLGDKDLSDRYIAKASILQNNIKKYAYNKAGFFNSVFNDNGEWIFSDKDPDGNKRVYGPSNYYAILCGAADQNMQDKVWENIEELRCESGYKLFHPALGKQRIEKVGRIASGDMPDGQWENSTVYNHGSHGFMLRALAHSGKGDKLEEVMQYLLPYNQNTHPIDKTRTAPYAIVNCYQNLPMNRHRGGMPFLTGSIAMAIRAVYEWMFGLKVNLDSLEIKSCFKTDYINRNVKLKLRDKNLNITYSGYNKDNTFKITINGKLVSDSKFMSYKINFADLIQDNNIEIIY